MKDANVFDEKHHRESVRLEGFDYGTDGAYFVTICSYKKQRTFSEIINGEILGKIIEEELKRTIDLRKNATVTEWIISLTMCIALFSSTKIQVGRHI